MANSIGEAGNPEMMIVSRDDAALAAHAATVGDLGLLGPEQRTALYGAICRSVGLNPATQPFAYIKLNGKLTLYALKGATDQLRKLNGVSVVSVEKDVVGDVLMVTVTVRDGSGRQDTDIGAVPIKGLAGEALANAYMKAITKAKRRVTLSIAGLGFLDESEVTSIPRAEAIVVDPESGEITSPPVPRDQRLRAIARGAPGDTHQEAVPDAIADTRDARKRAYDELVAWATGAGVTRADLHYAAQALFASRNVTGPEELSAVDLQAMHVKLKEKSGVDHAKLLQWFDQINPDGPQARGGAPVGDASTVEGRLPGVDDNAEMDRNIDAVAERFRS